MLIGARFLGLYVSVGYLLKKISYPLAYHAPLVSALGLRDNSREQCFDTVGVE
jgi:hypothetical protein